MKREEEEEETRARFTIKSCEKRKCLMKECVYAINTYAYNTVLITHENPKALVSA